MGKAPTFIDDYLQNGFQSGSSLKSKGCETIITIRDKRYVIGASNDDTAQSIGVLIINEATGDRVIPVVLGTKPKACKGLSAVTVNEERFLVIKKGFAPDDSVWFLEVNTQYVREQKKRRGGEVVAWSKGVAGDAEKPIVITGPSGVGKGTLISMLMEEFPSVFGFSVSHTTRAPRSKEKDGVHYHFTERSAMEQDIEDGKFLEHASVHGNLYGTSIEAVEMVADSGKRCILDIDVQGARSVRDSSLEAIFIFICPPSMEELEKRLRKRGTETEEQIQKRFKNAKEEIKKGKSSGIFNHLLINDNLEECYKRLKKLLGLDGNAVNTQKSSPQGIEIPEDHSVIKKENKIFINCGTPELEKASKNLIGLDVSSLKGGAPFRTRGLDVYTVDSFSDGLNGI